MFYVTKEVIIQYWFPIELLSNIIVPPPSFTMCYTVVYIGSPISWLSPYSDVNGGGGIVLFVKLT